MPFGIVYAPNLTPDKETGLGSWTEKMFLDAIRNGKHMGGNGRAILPPMPWMDLGGAAGRGPKAVYAYLKSIPEVRQRGARAQGAGAGVRRDHRELREAQEGAQARRGQTGYATDRFRHGATGLS